MGRKRTNRRPGSHARLVEAGLARGRPRLVNEVDTKLANDLIPITSLTLEPAAILAWAILATVVFFTMVWAIHVKMRDAGVVDFFWGAGFVLIAWLIIALRGTASTAALLLAALVTLWAVRLTIHMVSRHRHMNGEDSRYAAMRESTGESFWWKSLVTIYLVQSVIMLLVAAPIFLAVLSPTAAISGPAMIAGAALFAVGLAIETLADQQLWRFKAEKKNRGQLMTGGLFAYSRHPNYFGEALLWWGLGLIALAGTGSLWTLAGPALLTLLLLKVSGVSMLDAHLKRTKPGYDAWAARTSAFVPLPPRN
jgi:steroid 5-alpha reductase family enzyme